MKRKLILAAAVALVLSAGTLFTGINSSVESKPGALCDALTTPCIQETTDTRGFPFSVIEEYEDRTNQAIQDETSFVAPAVVGNFIVWFAVVLLGLLFLDWLAGFVGKLIIRTIVGLALAAYGIFVLIT